MKFLLANELNDVDRSYLENLTHHEGYKVLVRLLNDQCAQANADVIKVDPESPDYEKKLAERQRKARFMSEFCTNVLSSVDSHVYAITRERIDKAAEEEDARQLLEVIRTAGAIRGPEITAINSRRAI